MVFDSHPNGWQQLGPSAWGVYPAAGLTGVGIIEARRVRCLHSGVPGARPLRRLGLPKLDHQALSRQIRHTVSVTHLVAGPADLIGKEPITELGVIPVRVEHRVATYAASSSPSVIKVASHR
jgi:hypothetical protein